MPRSSDRIPVLPSRVFNNLSAKYKAIIGKRVYEPTPSPDEILAGPTTKTTRSVSVFLDQTIQEYKCDIAYIQAVRDGLVEAQDHSKITREEFRQHVIPFLEEAREAKNKLSLVEHQKRLIEEDLEDAISLKRPKQDNGPSIELLEKAYTESILRRVMAASRQKKSGFDQSTFRKDVQNYYDISLEEGYCHVLGVEIDKDFMKAAHLVPKSLTGGEICYLYGPNTDPTTREDPRNAVCLYNKIEEGLDNGTIVIIPISQSESEIGQPTRWKCILANESSRNKMVIDQNRFSIRMADRFPLKRFLTWGDIDGRELEFVGNNRPARRFLYFRFIITYLFHKRNGDTGFSKKIDNIQNFWPTPGPYLRKSMLVSLARNVSGHDIPPNILETTTFEDEDNTSTRAHGRLAGTTAAQDLDDLYDAMLVSVKAAQIEYGGSEGSSGSNGISDYEADDSKSESVVFEDCAEML